MPDNSKDLSQYGENGLSGIYRAFVVDNMDPLKLARVRIRVPMIHGVSAGPNYLNDAQVPWSGEFSLLMICDLPSLNFYFLFL